MTNGRRSARARNKSAMVAGGGDSHGTQEELLLKIRKKSRPFSRSLRLLDGNLKWIVVFGITVLLALYYVTYYYDGSAISVPRLRIITPLPAPKMMDLPQFQGKHKESLYWGTYRPHVYLGIRARRPRSLLAGLMWIGVKKGQYHLRHVCQDSDDLRTYGWIHHNGRDYGKQVIVDHDLTLTTSFLKFKMVGSGYGGDWAVRIDAQNTMFNSDDKMQNMAHVFFYLADEEGNALNINTRILYLDSNTLLAFGSREEIGSWELHLHSQDNLASHFCGFRSHHMHNLTELFLGALSVQAGRTGLLQLPDTYESSPNIVLFQLSSLRSFSVDLALLSGTDLKDSRVKERFHTITGTSLTNKLDKRQRDFEHKFMECFHLMDKIDADSLIVAKAAIGNLLGGIGYFYGHSRVALTENFNGEIRQRSISYWPAELWSSVPSRSFFPRGFLWDEGFHQLLIWRWDIDICLDIIGHWLDLMNIDGWIPREQILGAEALSKVPEEFVRQHPTNANPPTLFFVLRDLVAAIKSGFFSTAEREKIMSFLERAFVRLDAWFHWFHAEQSGWKNSSYYWHGRDNLTVHELNPKTLSSGLDDYPRASHPSVDERHIDLRCWMLLAANCMHSVAELLGKSAFSNRYFFMANQLSNFELLNEMHLDVVSGAYFDFGNHSEKVQLRWRERHGSYADRELVREVLEEPYLKLVPHFGYVSLFPFFMKIIPAESWIIEKQLDLIYDQTTVWTSFGLRSLSKASSLFMKHNTQHDPPYWRGPIWINMNYLILGALHHYSQVDGHQMARARTVYEELRKNLIRNIVKNYFHTGYLWEHYDESRGSGKGAHPFTGWTSLLVLVMAELY